jgi:cysteine desulfurase
MLALPIYMDNHATTRTDPRVVAAMVPYFTECYGNPASKTHSFGQAAEAAVKQARQEVAAIIGAVTREVIFTSGATESNNLAIKGIARAYQHKGKHIVTLQTEHKSVLDVCAHLQRDGFQITYLPVQSNGLVDLETFERALRPDTILVSVLLANNEIGVIQPIAEAAKICHQRGVFMHTDATQAVGKIPVDVHQLDVDLLSFTAHKLYGPKGCGALYIRRSSTSPPSPLPQAQRGAARIRLDPLIDGGGHELGLRSGTLATPVIIGFATACQLAAKEMSAERVRLRQLRDRLWTGLQTHVTDIVLNGDWEQRLPGNLNVSFAGVKGESLLLDLREIALSSGSACTTTDSEPSHVLRALGRDDDLADASLRFGLGRFNTAAEVDYVVKRVAEAVAKLRKLSSS